MKKYTFICTICDKTFTAQRSDADTCGSTCRKTKSRRKKELRIRLLYERNALNEDNIAILRNRLNILEKKNEELTKYGSGTAEKILVEPVSPESDHKQDRVINCTETDLWILMARLMRQSNSTQSGEFIGTLFSPKLRDEMIADFESRFDCRFKDAKEAFPWVQQKKDSADNWEIIKRYGELKYSK